MTVAAWTDVLLWQPLSTFAAFQLIQAGCAGFWLLLERSGL